MLCDVDLGRPDGSRTHTVAVAAGLAGEGLDVRLVARGPDPALPGVAYRPGAPSSTGRLARIVGVNRAAIAELRRAPPGRRAFYVRKDWGSLPAPAVARALGGPAGVLRAQGLGLAAGPGRRAAAALSDDGRGERHALRARLRATPGPAPPRLRPREAAGRRPHLGAVEPDHRHHGRAGGGDHTR